VALNAAECQSLTPAQKPWLTSEYARYQSVAIACPVHRPGEAPALYVVSLDALQLERSLASGTPAPTLPKAMLVRPDGRIVGQLRNAFPSDPPLSFDLTFSEWIDELPRYIEVFVEDPTVTGNRKLPALRWRDTLDKYIELDTSDGH
jgi:hypothetical protein